MATADLDYKARKEAFVSNLSGSTITDINTVASVPAVSSAPESKTRNAADWLRLLSSCGQLCRLDDRSSSLTIQRH